MKFINETKVEKIITMKVETKRIRIRNKIYVPLPLK